MSTTILPGGFHRTGNAARLRHGRLHGSTELPVAHGV